MLRTLALACVAAGLAAAAAVPGNARPTGECHVPAPTHLVTFTSLSEIGLSCETASHYALHIPTHGTPHGFVCSRHVHGRDVRWHCVLAAHPHASFTLAYRVR